MIKIIKRTFGIWTNFNNSPSKQKYTINVTLYYYGIWGDHLKNPVYRIFQTEYSGCLDVSAHA